MRFILILVFLSLALCARATHSGEPYHNIHRDVTIIFRRPTPRAHAVALAVRHVCAYRDVQQTKRSGRVAEHATDIARASTL